MTGLFETMKWENGKIQLKDLHFERLFKGLELLQWELPQRFTPGFFSNEISSLCVEKRLKDLVRVRLSVYQTNNNTIHEIEEEEFPSFLVFQKDLKIDIYPSELKPCDKFSNLKSIPFDPYTGAAKFAAEQKLDDCIVLNTKERVADSSISNIFLIKNNLLKTPALTEGCVAGVMRKYLISQLPNWGYDCAEAEIEIDDLFEADEVFLTNALRGIRSVKQFRDKTYDNLNTNQIIEKLKQTISSTYC